jgi:sensor histidine kinase YesM
MLLVPLVENALKHCDFPINPRSFARIELKSSAQKIEFSVVNTFQPGSVNLSERGLGLRNVKERLSIFYHNRYLLDIDKTPDTFKIKVEIHGADQMHSN